MLLLFEHKKMTNFAVSNILFSE